MRLFQALQGWFFSPDRCLCAIGGVVLHMALIFAHTPLFIAALALFSMVQSCSVHLAAIMALGVIVELYCYAPVYFKTMSLLNLSALPITLFLAAVLIMLWFAWSYVYLDCLKRPYGRLYASVWVCGSVYIWEALGIGLYNVGVLWGNSPWRNLLPSFGLFAVFVLVLSSMWLRETKGAGLIVLWVLALFMKQPGLPQTNWLSEIEIYPEGVSAHITQGNAIVGSRAKFDDGIYNAGKGIGQVHGASYKKHLVPFTEGGYTPGRLPRLLQVGPHKILLLICYDALFTDITAEVSEADAIVITGMLTDFNQTPMPKYFQKVAMYLSILYHKPTFLVDGLSDVQRFGTSL